VQTSLDVVLSSLLSFLINRCLSTDFIWSNAICPILPSKTQSTLVGYAFRVLVKAATVTAFKNLLTSLGEITTQGRISAISLPKVESRFTNQISNRKITMTILHQFRMRWKNPQVALLRVSLLFEWLAGNDVPSLDEQIFVVVLSTNRPPVAQLGLRFQSDNGLEKTYLSKYLENYRF